MLSYDVLASFDCADAENFLRLVVFIEGLATLYILGPMNHNVKNSLPCAKAVKTFPSGDII